MTAMYCVIAVGGAIGNVLTCLVVAKNRTMRTSTNYYLVNLAVADLLTLFLGILELFVALDLISVLLASNPVAQSIPCLRT
ncbi:Neuromedin-U receptor 1 [Portunus trituberculatus]|uniref:Neuromedin-U receptor 1 n=1 Tax=Portunus trituberculatus TaxID=210409 RepID=A0A5B7JLC8_PORTR|nr:Neuromedin-U receptor 1 [Portunus trituberculatus]